MLLEPLRRALERAGFLAVNWRYGSLRGSIETHAGRLAAKATELVDDDADVGRLHFVGHSMGAIVVRRDDLPCSPCIYRGHALGTPQGCPPRPCLTELRIDPVLLAARRLLRRPTALRPASPAS